MNTTKMIVLPLNFGVNRFGSIIVVVVWLRGSTIGGVHSVLMTVGCHCSGREASAGGGVVTA